MAPRATRAGAPLADRQPHHHSPSSASRVPQIRKRPRGSGSARRARTRRARAPEVVAGGVSARPDARPRRHRPGTIQDEPGNARDGRGYANAKKAILAPRVFVKRAKRRNGNAGRTSQPARRAWPCTRGRCETCRRGPRGRSSGSSCRTPRVAFATRVVHGRSDLSQSLARNSLEAGISPSCACQPSLFRRIVWANSLKRRRTGADSEWHRHCRRAEKSNRSVPRAIPPSSAISNRGSRHTIRSTCLRAPTRRERPVRAEPESLARTWWSASCSSRA